MFESTSGIPQSLNLCSIVFNLFMYDMIDSLSGKNLHADDKVFHSIDSLDDYIRVDYEWCQLYELNISTFNVWC